MEPSKTGLRCLASGSWGWIPPPGSAPPRGPAQGAREALGTEPWGRPTGKPSLRPHGNPRPTLELVVLPLAGWNPAPPPPPTAHSTQRGQWLWPVFRKAEVSSASCPSIWTTASPEWPGVQDALGLAEAPSPWAAQLRTRCGWGFWAQSQCLALSRNGNRQDSGIGQCSRAEAAEGDSACAGLSLSGHRNNNSHYTHNDDSQHLLPGMCQALF